MQDLLIFLYCSAASAQMPTRTEWWCEVCELMACVAPAVSPPHYDVDPVVVASFVHGAVEPEGFDLAHVSKRFLGPGAEVGASVWGPPAWRLLHALARHPTGWHVVGRLLKAFTVLMPCQTCREHLVEHLREFDVGGAHTSDAMYRYTTHLHAAVKNQS